MNFTKLKSGTEKCFYNNDLEGVKGAETLYFY